MLLAALGSRATGMFRWPSDRPLYPNHPHRFAFRWVRIVITVLVAAWGLAAAAAETLWITEFSAQNDRILIDDFGEYSDWIEIHNSGDTPASLGGYYLTDDPANLTQWRFPDAELPPGGYLVVFASGANRTMLGRPFHTNFRLSSQGEYLALVKPDGVTIAQQFAPAYPPQAPDVSYGLAVEELLIQNLVAAGATGKFYVPTNSFTATWTGLDFDDTPWRTVQTPVKFDRATGEYDRLTGTDVEVGMYGVNATAYLRVPFAGSDTSKLNDLQLAMRYDDGFIAYLNGQEIARRFAPANLTWSVAATGQRSNSVSLLPERFNLTARTNLLRPGGNVLAIHGLNRTSADPDFLIVPELIGRSVRVVPAVQRYFEAPTPGAANAGAVLGTASEVRFSRESTTYTAPFQLELEIGEPVAGAVIRYTLDRTIPTEASALYAGPLTIDTSLQVRARVFAPGYIPGPVASETFLLIGPTAVQFTSDLPIIVIHTLGGGTIGGNIDKAAVITIHEPVRGRSALTNAPHLVSRVGIKTRGSSTGSQAKANFAVELWGDEDDAEAKPILGMPADADWVFHAPFNWDPSSIRNPLAFEMSMRLGRYAPRYRFAEVYVNSTGTGGPVTAANYHGLYNIMEKIKRGPHRVAIDELRPFDHQPPEITGGYILKIDRTDPGDSGFFAGGRSIAYVEPKESEMESPQRDPQEKYLAGYLNAFAAALNGAAFTDPVRGYAPYIDAGSWIDHHIVDTFTFNVDALRLSSYFHKVRNGPLVYGPVWDYDRSMESTDDRDNQARSWGAGFFTEPWWARLFRDPNFWQRWIDRWQAQRQGSFSDQALIQLIDSLGDQVAEAAPRDFTRWRQPKRGNSQAGELNHLKNWLLARAEFFDTNFVAKPIFSHDGGQVPPGFTLSISGPANATIYYTIDGSDPRLFGGQLSPAALEYSAPIRIDKAVTIRARARNPSQRHASGTPIHSPWSGPTEARFTEHPLGASGGLLVTELHYSPPGPTAAELQTNHSVTDDDFEFLELKNVTGAPIDLSGARFSSGIDFVFGPNSLIGPGQSIVLVKNLGAFKSRYGERPNVVGPYSGNLNDQGERLHLVNVHGLTLIDFAYEPDWFRISDRLGFSLVLTDEKIAMEALGRKSSWRPSAQPGGSPSIPDPEPRLLPRVLVNEVLPWSNGRDAIELFNASPGPADIGGWYLTDNREAPRKYRIRNGTIIPAGGYWVIDDGEFDSSAAAGFALNRAGEGVYLFSADSTGNLQWYMHGHEYTAAERNVSFGRHLTSSGGELFVAQARSTLGAVNAGPRVGPVVINEFMYHPPDLIVNGESYDLDEDEFVELKNITHEPVPLFDLDQPGNPWRLASAIQYSFPTNVVLAAQETILVVSFDPGTQPDQLARFRTRYGIGDNAIRVFGPFSGKFDNSSDVLRLWKPGEPTQDGEVPSVLVDQVKYNDSSPWPAAADGAGYSLQRLDGNAFGDDATSWGAALPTPGTANRFGPAPVVVQHPQSQQVVSGERVLMIAGATGTGPLRYQWRFEDRNLINETNSVLTIPKVTSDQAGRYVVLVMGPTGAVASSAALLTVRNGPQFVFQPLSRKVFPGTNATFAATVRTTGPASFQWRVDGRPIPGATEPSLTLRNVQLDQMGLYTLEVRDTVGSIVSDPAALLVLVRPVIVNQPASQIAMIGDTVRLNVNAIGTKPLSYRWRRNGVILTTETNATLILRNIRPEQAGAYSVLITNLASGSSGVLSSEASVWVMADSDRDRIPDLWETANGLAANDANDALADPDGDGVSNLLEFAADTNPRDPTSYFKIDLDRRTVEGAYLNLEVRSNRAYQVQVRNELLSGQWETLTNLSGASENRMQQILDANPGSSRFYRVIIPAP